MNEEVITAKNFFSTHGLRLSDEWLESCINWCHEENQGASITKEALHKQIYEQWLLLDLRDVELSILPLNLSQQKKTILRGEYYLQMMCVVDISRPKYWQIQRIRDNNSIRISDLENEHTNNKRVLQLTLSDGVQEIKAVELYPIKILHLNLTPGVKIEIIGPVSVRRGQILLEEKNIKVLGGEIEELLIQNAAENVIARALGLTENPNPNEISENLENVNETTQNSSTYSMTQKSKTYTQTMITNNQSQIITAPDKKQNTAVGACKNQQNVIARDSKDFQSKSFGVSREDEERIATEIDMLLEVENTVQKECLGSFKNAVQKKSGPSASINSCKKPASKTVQSKSVFEMEDDDIFDDLDIDAHLDFIDINLLKDEQKNKGRAITAIADIKKMKVENQKFTINAKFKAVLEKLTVTNSQWHLKILIGDSTETLTVWVHTDLITKLIGFSGADMENLKKGIDNSLTKQKLLEVIVNLKQHISNLNGEMEVEFIKNEELPFITSIG